MLSRISRNVDTVVSLSATDAELRHYVLKFQLEQAADKAAYEAAGQSVNKLDHLRKVLQRMVDLALAVAQQVLRRTLEDFQSHVAVLSGDVKATVSQTPTSSEMLQTSSVADFAEGTETWLESGAHLSAQAVEILAMVLIAHSQLRPALQAHMLEMNIVPYLAEALAVSRDHELSYFQEGYKTEHMRLVANFVFENPAASRAILQDERLLKEILSGTKVDEENPGMVEWSEFAIRSLCEVSQDARDRIKQLTPMLLSKETTDLLHGRVDCAITEDGKVKLKKRTTAHEDQSLPPAP